MRQHPIQENNYRLYMDVGSLEGAEKQNIQQKMVPNTMAAYALLKREGSTRLVVEEGAVHGGTHFARRFPEAIQWLFSDR